jgi:mono/diheme cytochrome c family protein
VCHGEDGQGADGPPIIDSRIVPNGDRFIRRVLNGGQLMPAFGQRMSDREIAAVATYVRNSFGYDLDPIAEEEVSDQR